MDKKYKILCTGNPSRPGLPKSIQQEFSNVKFLSLSAGYNLSSLDGQIKFRNLLKDYNVFINVSNLPNGAQEQLLKITREEWDSGHVFNIGSIAEYKKWEWFNKHYTEEKRKLRETSLELCSERFKTTHIIAGGFQDYENNDPVRMDPIEIVKIIKYILDSPINIPIVGIEKIINKETEKY
jgi:NADP-dependent 3-hydroxy acid dehydrogenase YdfG